LCYASKRERLVVETKYDSTRGSWCAKEEVVGPYSVGL
jgi:hypothetical protein